MYSFRLSDSSDPDEFVAATRPNDMDFVVTERFRELIEASADQPFCTQEICRNIGVSDRTLGLACQHQLGVSPGQYHALRRMRLVRRAFRQADLNMTNVTDIATKHGFWELRRFGGNRVSASLQ